jgi:hypothetical protein
MTACCCAAFRDSQEHLSDNLVIEEYLNSYYLTVPITGQTDDQDVVFTKIPTEERSLRSCLINSGTFPNYYNETLAFII